MHKGNLLNDINVDISYDSDDYGEDMTNMLGDHGTGMFRERDAEGNSTQSSI